MIAKAECGVVLMESTTLVDVLPAGSDAGENVGLAPTGKPETVNMTVPSSVPFDGATIKPKVAGLPALTVMLAAGAVTLKSATVSVSALVEPPPGDGLLTVTLNGPLCAKSLGNSDAVSDVELT